MDLFIVEDEHIAVTTEALNIKHFKDVWDSQNDKGVAIAMLSYVEFMCSYKKSNPFIGYLKLHERSKKIVESLPVEIDPNNPLILDALDKYRELQKDGSPTVVFYESALKASEKLVDFFNTFDFNKVNHKSGLPLYKPADITRALKDTDDMIKTLASMRSKVYQELLDAGVGKAGRIINYFERSENA